MTLVEAKQIVGANWRQAMKQAWQNDDQDRLRLLSQAKERLKKEGHKFAKCQTCGKTIVRTGTFCRIHELASRTPRRLVKK